MDNVELIFEEDALNEIALLAMNRKTGARGLRAILESAMVNVMFDIPSREDIDKCIITKETIKDHIEPIIVYLDPGTKKTVKKQSKKGSKTKRDTAS